MLEIRGLTRYFGGVVALDGFDMNVNQGEIVGLIGPNGAGKTTAFNLITGYLRPNRGKIVFEGKDITGKRPHSIAGMGIVRTFQLSSIFPNLTVLQNVVTACHLKPKVGLWEVALHTPSSRRKGDHTLSLAREILSNTGLDTREDKIARELSSGWRRTLAIAIALAAEPRLLLMDEPVTTLDPERVTTIMNLVTRVRESGITVLMIEHNMRAIMDYCDRIVVLAFGKCIAEGLPEEVRQNQKVINAYLGV